MVALKVELEEVTKTKIKGAEPPTRQFKPDPPPGRKMSREESLKYIFEKYNELYRQLD